VRIKWQGQSKDYRRLSSLRSYRWWGVIEDVAAALGATYSNCQSFCPIYDRGTVTPDCDQGARFWIPALAPDSRPGLAGMTSGRPVEWASRVLYLVLPNGHYFWQMLYRTPARVLSGC
jgi:hypothetical protein